MESINVVWLKRDLRSQDHAPLEAAECAGIPYLIIYLFEPSILHRPDAALRHHQFVYHSLLSLNEKWAPLKRQVVIMHTEAVTAFEYLQNEYNLHTVFSHQETGIEFTWQRDKQVAHLLSKHNIMWKEYARDGIIRGITHRKGWDKHWFVTMSKPIIENTYTQSTLLPPSHPFPLPDSFYDQLMDYPDYFQPAGEDYGWDYLRSFAAERGIHYNKYISKPQESRHSGGRISPYLAWGNLSIKQAYQYVKNHENFAQHKRPFGAFLTRLKWHCHFIQKFEVECVYEHTCINRGYELLERESDATKLEAWKKGQTGFPMVDACMRSVTQTGWINFRMRAMMVSFLCHHLDQDWRKGVYHLAHQFLDYEPGIHYPQFQMQAGTTGINTVRIYNPVKQSQDHDPEGIFIKKWIPELSAVPKEHIHQPWLMTEMEQSFYGIKIGQDYPAPIVDLALSGKNARTKIWGHRKNDKVKEENRRILATHTRAGKK